MHMSVLLLNYMFKIKVFAFKILLLAKFLYLIIWEYLYFKHIQMYLTPRLSTMGTIPTYI